MKGDFSRFTHKPEKHYTSVLKQQGRVDLDADWNEQACIQAYLNEEGSKDILGPSGTPSRQAGFGILNASIGENGIDFSISPGRIYVDGIFCQLEGKGVTYLKQPYYINPEMIKAPGAGRRDLIYLDVWKRHVTAVEDDSLREIALGGPDTTTRLKTIWQVKALAGVSKANPCNIAEWKNLISTSELSKLSVKLDASKPEEKPCAADLEAGYRGRENRLYRVEIHNGGIIKAGSAASGSNPTFKWSRDNGSVLFPIYELDKQNKRKLKLRRLGKDQFLNLHKGDWVEVLDDSRELAGEPGIMAEVTEDIDEEQLIVTLSKEISDIDIDNGHAKLRRWDQKEDAIRIIPEALIDLEAGLQISFSKGKFRTGDYWVFAARSNGEVELLDSVPPMGIEHHYCILALVTWMMVNGKLKAVVLDCRKTFPSLTDLICLYYIGGDGQEAKPGQPLMQPLQVGVSNGSQTIKGPLASGMKVEFEIIDSEKGVLSKTIEFPTEPNSKVISEVDDKGIAKCFWKLGTEPVSQQVEAKLIDACRDPVHLPIRFSANLSIASEVAYDEPRCGHMNAENVRDALSTLCENYGLYYVGGDGQEGLPGSMLDHPLQVRVSNGIWPEANATVDFKVESGGGQLSDNNATTNVDGIAEVQWTLGVSGIQRVKASLSNAPTMPIFFNAGLKAIGGPSCQIPVGGQSAYRELADALNDLINVKRMSNVCLCLLPGNYSFPEGDWTLNSPDARVKIVGSGLGSVIYLKKTTMLMKGLASLSLKDLKIDAGNLNRDGLVLDNCCQIDIESCSLTGDAAAASQANGSLLKISNARHVHIENNDIEVKPPSVTARPHLIINKRDFPEFNEVVRKRDSVDFDSAALKFTEKMKSMDPSERKRFKSRFANAIGTHRDSMTPVVLESYNIIIDATTRDDIPSKAVADAFRGIVAYETEEINLASALTISDANADTVIDKNRIEGTISIYGIPTSKGLILNDLYDLEIPIFTGSGKVLYLRGNQMGRLVIGNKMTEMIKKIIEEPKQGNNIVGAFKSSFFSENVIKGANNQIASDHLSFCSNVFEDDKYDAGMAISNSAIFMGNYSQYNIKFISLSNHLSKDAGNLIIQIGP